MVSCVFCHEDGFANLGASWEGHLMALTNMGLPVCPKMSITTIVSMDSKDTWIGKEGQYYRDTGSYLSEEKRLRYLEMQKIKDSKQPKLDEVKHE